MSSNSKSYTVYIRTINKRKRAFVERLSASYAAVIAGVLAITFLVFYQVQAANILDNIDTNFSSVSSMLADDPMVISALNNGSADTELTSYLDNVHPRLTWAALATSPYCQQATV